MINRDVLSQYIATDEAELKIFVGFFVGISALLICIMLFSLWLVFTIGSHNQPTTVSLFVILLCFLLVSPISWISVELLLQFYMGWTVMSPLKLRSIVIRFALPMVELFVRVIKGPIEPVRRSFIAINNLLLLKAKLSYEPHDVLVLAPHCSQASRCKLRLTYNNDNCARCGKCPIGSLLELRDESGVKVLSATGGTMARRIIKEVRPKMIVGIACERDLVEGIHDIPSFFPVYGFLNECPNGPCIDTLINVGRLRKVLKEFIPSLHFSSEEKSETTPLKKWVPPSEYTNIVAQSEKIIQ